MVYTGLPRFTSVCPPMKDIEGKNFDVVHDIGAMSGYKEIEGF
jgi:hypothetical protein